LISRLACSVTAMVEWTGWRIGALLLGSLVDML
jgi:hypothetical protein